MVKLFGGPAGLALAVREVFDASAVKGKRHLRLRILLAMVKRHPDLVMSAAEELGWTVVPPDAAGDAAPQGEGAAAAN